MQSNANIVFYFKKPEPGVEFIENYVSCTSPGQLCHKIAQRHCYYHVECHTAQVIYDLYERACGNGRVHIHAFQDHRDERSEARGKKHGKIRANKAQIQK